MSVNLFKSKPSKALRSAGRAMSVAKVLWMLCVFGALIGSSAIQALEFSKNERSEKVSRSHSSKIIDSYFGATGNMAGYRIYRGDHSNNYTKNDYNNYYSHENAISNRSNLGKGYRDSMSHRLAQNNSRSPRQKVRSRNEVMKEVKSRYNAQVLKIVLNDKASVYRVRILMPNGRVKEISVSATR